MKILKTLIIMVSLTQSIRSQTNDSDTAILLIEFQKTWTEKGIFHFLIKKQYETRDVLRNTRDLLSKARKSEITIIQAPLILDKDDKYRYKKAPLPARLLNRFEKGTWKAEFTDGIKDFNDIVIKGRSSYDSTIDSDLLQVLNERSIKNLYICGFTTNHCVKETMNSLIDKGFNCILVSDCTATMNKRLQNKTENEFMSIGSKELIKMITNRLAMPPGNTRL